MAFCSGLNFRDCRGVAPPERTLLSAISRWIKITAGKTVKIWNQDSPQSRTMIIGPVTRIRIHFIAFDCHVIVRPCTLGIARPVTSYKSIDNNKKIFIEFQGDL